MQVTVSKLILPDHSSDGYSKSWDCNGFQVDVASLCALSTEGLMTPPGEPCLWSLASPHPLCFLSGQRPGRWLLEGDLQSVKQDPRGRTECATCEETEPDNHWGCFLLWHGALSSVGALENFYVSSLDWSVFHTSNFSSQIKMMKCGGDLRK